MKKLLSAVLSVALMLPFCSIASNALTSGVGYFESEKVSIIKYDPTTKVGGESNTYSAIPFFADTADSPYMFYSFLNANQKSVYNEVKKDPIKTAFTVSLASPLTWSSTTTGVPADIQSQLSADVMGGLTAVADDNPMIFWINGYQISYSYSMSGSTYNYVINEVTVIINLNTSAYADMTVVSDYYTRMKAVADEITISDGNRFEKVKAIHDFIANRVVYDPDLGTAGENPTDHEPTSVFLEPYTTVCEGYAESFKILCDKAGIPCVVVVGTANGGGHAWNYVKMDDNKWYAVDCTWDDQGSILYDFFLVGSDTVNAHFDAASFSSSHTPTGKRYNSTLFSLVYPPLQANSFSDIVLNINSKAVFSIPDSRIFIVKGTTVASQIYVPSGYSYSVTGNKTGSVYTVKDSQGAVANSYSVVMWGDIVPNGTIDNSDYNAAINYSLSNQDNIDKSSLEYAAADVNRDGAVDLFDASQIDLIVAGKA